jgi:glycosyltransferase involved in cell wall biosynthesis
MGKNIGFISTRFAGTDGVTIESSKWASVLEDEGHRCFWLAGELERGLDESMLVPEAHFKYEDNLWINQKIFGCKGRSSDVTLAIHTLKRVLKNKIEAFVSGFEIDLLVIQNALTIPLHVPLGVAITEFIAETQIPTIAHHHDFYWERTRFIVNAVGDYLRMSFPPSLPSMEHVVINSGAQEELALRTGITSVIIPNVLDFDNPPRRNDDSAMAFRNEIGLSADDKIILQPTRVVQRKGIEHALQLVGDLRDPRYKLVISHEAGDEGYEYLEWLKKESQEHGVDLRMVDLKVSDPYYADNNDAGYSLWDIYPHADFITYPSLYEGFGNAFLEAIYFYKPLLINRYAIFVRDIEPKGFDLAVMDGFLTQKNVQTVKEILESPERRKKMVEHNYEIAKRYYSFKFLRSRLSTILMNFFGMVS